MQRPVGRHFARRGPTVENRKASDVAFRVAAAAVMLAATILGIVVGLTHPTWMPAAAILGVGVLLATYVFVRARHTATS